ncbi:ATP-binding protein [Bacteroidota bacterium]
MIREVAKIDEELCNGCGLCVPSCHKGALQIIDGKARLISDLMCDGLGACLGHCPEGAITIEKREAKSYDEVKVMETMVEKGENTVAAHLSHLKEHNEKEYLQQGVDYLRARENELLFSVSKIIEKLYGYDDFIENEEQQIHLKQMEHEEHTHAGTYPGTRTMTFEAKQNSGTVNVSGESQLRQWPVQMHLVNPMAPYFRNTDVVLAADCVAYALGNFHDMYLKGKGLAITCPKLDNGQDSYMEKLQAMIDEAQINTLHVLIMQVPCCMGLIQMAKTAIDKSNRRVPLKMSVVGIEGEILREEWI